MFFKNPKNLQVLNAGDVIGAMQYVQGHEKLKDRVNPLIRGNLMDRPHILDKLGCDEGWLLVFDRRTTITWKEKIFWKEETVRGKRVHVVGC